MEQITIKPTKFYRQITVTALLLFTAVSYIIKLHLKTLPVVF